MDFTKPKALGAEIKLEFPALIYGKGYDNCWAVDNYTPGKIQIVATLTDHNTGRSLSVLTDPAAAEIYTGNWLAGCPANKSGRSYDDYDGVAIECQNFPDAPNHPKFPTSRLNPNEKYNETIIFKFTTL